MGVIHRVALLDETDDRLRVSRSSISLSLISRSFRSEYDPRLLRAYPYPLEYLGGSSYRPSLVSRPARSIPREYPRVGNTESPLLSVTVTPSSGNVPFSIASIALRFTTACQSVGGGGGPEDVAFSRSALALRVYLDRSQNINAARKMTPQIESGAAMTAVLGRLLFVVSASAAVVGVRGPVVMFMTA
jgi:hypothetical protein